MEAAGANVSAAISAFHGTEGRKRETFYSDRRARFLRAARGPERVVALLRSARPTGGSASGKNCDFFGPGNHRSDRPLIRPADCKSNRKMAVPGRTDHRSRPSGGARLSER